MDKDKILQAKQEIADYKYLCKHYDAFRVNYESVELVIEYIEYLEAKLKELSK